MEKHGLAYKEKAGFLEARAITRRWAKTFYTASLLLPRQKRDASYALYAMCRQSDESVDAGDTTQATARLQAIENDINLAYGQNPLESPLLSAFRSTLRTYAIPRSYFQELIEGMRMDLVKVRYANFDELYGYCYKVAGVVGLLMTHIFGYKDPRTLTYAVDLGIAMQLTNILRDIQEDYGRGRIYLPQDEMASFGIQESQLAAKIVDAPLQRFLEYQISRARSFYLCAREGIPFITGRNSRLVILAMAAMYAGILDKVATSGPRVFIWRAHLNPAEKTAYLCAVLMKGDYL